METYGIHKKGEICELSEVIKFDEAEFCGNSYPIPGNWESYLMGIYGDYKQLPPEKDRYSHNITVFQV